MSVRSLPDRGFAAGLIRSNKQFLPGAHKPLIAPDEWAAYQRARAARATPHTVQPASFLLTGRLRCPCGSTMTTQGSPRRLFQCYSHHLPGANKRSVDEAKSTSWSTARYTAS